MNNPVCYIVLSGIIILCLVIYLQQKEHFASVEIHPDRRFGDLLSDHFNSNDKSNPTDTKEHTHDLSNYVSKNEIEPPKPPVDMSQYILKSTVEHTAKKIAETYCPVNSDFKLDDYIKKTEIPPPDANCPAVPDLKDFVLKSTIPPAQTCPSCICPRVKVQSGLCKAHPKQPVPKCPPPQPCDYGGAAGQDMRAHDDDLSRAAGLSGDRSAVELQAKT